MRYRIRAARQHDKLPVRHRLLVSLEYVPHLRTPGTGAPALGLAGRNRFEIDRRLLFRHRFVPLRIHMPRRRVGLESNFLSSCRCQLDVDSGWQRLGIGQLELSFGLSVSDRCFMGVVG